MWKGKVNISTVFKILASRQPWKNYIIKASCVPSAMIVNLYASLKRITTEFCIKAKKAKKDTKRTEKWFWSLKIALAKVIRIDADIWSFVEHVKD